MPTDPPNGVHSEVGRLRRVLVCEPGLAHRRLTPTNAADLLFDDVLWVENAQRPRAFVAGCGRATWRCSSCTTCWPRPWRCRAPATGFWTARSCPTTSGWSSSTTPASSSSGSSRAGWLSSSSAAWPPPTSRASTTTTSGSPRLPRRTRVRHAAAAQHPLHARHDLLAVRRRHPQPALLAGPPRRDAADEGRLPVPPRVRRLDRLVGRPRAGLGARDGRGRGRHAGRQRHRARRDERTDVTPGHHAAGVGTVRPGRRRARRGRRDAAAAGGDAPRHGVHVRGPRRGDALPEDRRRHPLLHPAARRHRGRRRHRRGHDPVRRRRRRLARAPGLRVIETGGDAYASDASSGTPGTTRSPSNRASCSPTTATPPPTRCCGRQASRCSRSAAPSWAGDVAAAIA